MRTPKQLQQQKMQRQKTTLLKQIWNYENDLTLRGMMGGKQVTLGEIHQLNELYTTATQFGYVRPNGTEH